MKPGLDLEPHGTYVPSVNWIASISTPCCVPSIVPPDNNLPGRHEQTAEDAKLSARRRNPVHQASRRRLNPSPGNGNQSAHLVRSSSLGDRGGCTATVNYSSQKRSGKQTDTVHAVHDRKGGAGIWASQQTGPRVSERVPRVSAPGWKPEQGNGEGSDMMG